LDFEYAFTGIGYLVTQCYEKYGIISNVKEGNLEDMLHPDLSACPRVGDKGWGADAGR
jgi:hypothetical protein